MTAHEGRKPLDYDRKRKELAEFLASEENTAMVLATCRDGRVMARPVSIASDGLNIYFLTWQHSRKCEQIRGNPRVALCKDRVQIEGTAELLGGLLDERNAGYTDILRRRIPGTVERWQDRPGMIIVRVKPRFAAVGGAIGDEVWLEYLDIEKEEAFALQWAHY